MWEDPNYCTVVLGALLHDIGKLYQRGDYGALQLEGQHPKLAADFVSAFRDFFEQFGQWIDTDLLQTLVQRHHQNAYAFGPELLAQSADEKHRPFAYLISEADHLSAAERGLHERGGFKDFKTVPLGNIFHSLEVRGRPASGAANLHPSEITDAASLKRAFPEDFFMYSDGELTPHIQAFGQEFNKRLRPELTGDFQGLLAHFLNILYRYTWCIPADTQEEHPDISLYDHLRTTCAIAACLYQTHADKHGQALEKIVLSPPSESEFLLVAGDVSGIQSYIFDIAHIGAGGVARRLRARCLMVQLFTAVAAREILTRLDLPQASEIMAAGGNFYLLLPNTPKARATIREVSQDLDRWSLAQLHGELALNLESVDMSRSDFQGATDSNPGFGGVLRRVNDALGKRKRQRFQQAFTEGNGWKKERLTEKGEPLDAFLLDVHYQGERVCRSCRKFPSEPNQVENLCRLCRTDKETGAHLPTTDIIRLARHERLLIMLPCGWSADIGPRNSSLAVGDIVIQLNDYDLANYGRREASARFMTNHVPDGPGKTVLTFEEIACEAQGRPMLGFLKMDVDNLGELMVFGLKRSQGEHRDTISRIMTLSRSLDTFFTGWVNHLLEDQFPMCYTIFSGGDDLFVAGPWDQVLELAGKVRDDFRKWVARDDVTISAGVVFTSPHYPISRAAAAEEALEVSKHTDGKDRITLLGHPLAWQEWQALSKRWKEVQGWSETAHVSTAFRYSLLEYGRMWQRYDRWRKHPKDDPGGVLGLRFQPLLAYNISRNLKRDNARELYQWAEGFTRPQPGWSAQQQLEVQHLELLAQLLIYSKGKEDQA